jgi:hypothetical protein
MTCPPRVRLVMTNAEPEGPQQAQGERVCPPVDLTSRCRLDAPGASSHERLLELPLVRFAAASWSSLTRNLESRDRSNC